MRLHPKRKRVYVLALLATSAFLGGTIATTWAVSLAWLRENRVGIVIPLNGRPDRVPNADADRYSRGTATTADGVELSFWFAAPMANMPTIIYFHGTGEVGGDHGYDMAPFLAVGYGVVLAEFRGHGGNPGIPTGAGLDEDGRTQAAWTAKQWPESPIVSWGESLGTGAALSVALDRTVKAVVLDAPYTSMADIQRLRAPLWPPVLWLEDVMDSLAKIRNVHAPVYIIEGEMDGTVPPEQARRMAAAAPCLGGAIFLPGVGHPAYSGRGNAALVKQVQSLLSADGVASCAAHGG